MRTRHTSLGPHWGVSFIAHRQQHTNSIPEAYQKHTRSTPEAYTEAYCIFHDILRFVLRRRQRPATVAVSRFLQRNNQKNNFFWPGGTPRRNAKYRGKYNMLLCMLLVCFWYASGMLLVCCWRCALQRQRYAVSVLLAMCITTPDTSQNELQEPFWFKGKVPHEEDCHVIGSNIWEPELPRPLYQWQR